MIFRLLLLVVALSPLPLGSNRDWAWSLCAVSVALLAVGWSIRALRAAAPDPFGFHEFKVSGGLAAGVLLWAGFQAASVSPSSWHHPLWSMAAQLLPGPWPDSAVSLDPEASLTAAMRLLAYLLVFALALQYCRARDNALAVFRWLAWGGFAYASYGLLIHLGGVETFLWHSPLSSRGSVSSTFVNRNTYATYGGLTLLCVLVVLTEKLSLSRHYDFSGFWGAQRLLEIAITRGWMPLVLLLTIGTALVLSYSRGGFLSTLTASLVWLMLLRLRRQGGGGPLTLGLAGACVVAVVVFFVSGDPLLERIDKTSVEEHRADIFRRTVDASAANPWLGAGYGSFEAGFRMYKDQTLPGRYDKAHNTYLENMFELGLPAALALFAALAGPAIACLAGVFRRRRDRIFPATGFAATVLVGLHALVDFSLQIPAVAMTYALLMGAACAQAFPSNHGRHRSLPRA